MGREVSKGGLTLGEAVLEAAEVQIRAELFATYLEGVAVLCLP